MSADFHYDRGDFVCLFCKCYNFGENVILGLGSEGNVMRVVGRDQKKSPLGKRVDVCVSAPNGEETSFA